MQEKEKEVLRYMKYSDFRVIVDSLTEQNTAAKNEMDPATKKDEDNITFSSPGGEYSL